MFNNMLMGAAGESIKATSFPVDNSAVFNKADAEYLAADSGFGTPSNADVGTLSMWFKRGNLGGTNLRLFTHGSGASVQIQAYLTSSDTLVVGNGTEVTTTQVFRDPHAWYNLVIRVDTSQETSSNRVRHYLNGSQITDFSASSYPSQNADVFTSTGWRIGSWSNSTTHTFDGYMSQVVYCDGQSLAPASFGETDDNGVWRPIDVSGLTFGNNGFYLNMAASGSDLGDDASGNSNDFTNTNSVTQSSDSPTKNYAVLSPLNLQANIALSEGNLKQVSSSNSQGMSFSSFPVTTGQKVYIEATISGASGGMTGCVKSTSAVPQNPSSDFDALASGDARLLNVASGDVFSADGVTVASNYAPNDSVPVTHMIALDLVNDKIYWGDAGVGASGWSDGSGSFNQSFDNAVGVDLDANLDWFFAMRGYNATIAVNFGQTAFTVDPPTGYSSGYSAAIENENRETALTTEDGSAYMQSSLWSGNSSSQTVSQSGNSTFTSDWVWIKDRNFGNGGNVFDSVRGSSKGLATFDDGTEDTNTDGVTFGAGTIAFTGAGNTGDINASGRTYVGWQWLAGNGTVSNSDGSLSSTVSANQTAGFSIVSYTGNGGSGGAQTVGHGLSGKTPKMILIKNRSATNNWVVYHFDVGLNAITLDTNAARITTGASVYWNDTHPTSSVFTVNTNAGVNGNTNSMIAYCFADVAGYSKFGAYIGNNNTNGPFVELGFKPSFVMIKAITQAESWWIGDDLRDGYNQGNRPMLTADQAAAEDNGWSGNAPYDALSNGFKIRRTGGAFNTNANSYLYMAFAVHPFAGTTPATAR